MKQLLLFFVLLCLCPFQAFAQNEDKTVALDEVIVNAPKVVSKADGQMIYPTDAQKDASTPLNRQKSWSSHHEPSHQRNTWKAMRFSSPAFTKGVMSNSAATFESSA